MIRRTVAEMKIGFQCEGNALSKFNVECLCCDAVLSSDNWDELGIMIFCHLLADCPNVRRVLALGEISHKGVTPK
jgi:hypothetical protein